MHTLTSLYLVVIGKYIPLKTAKRERELEGIILTMKEELHYRLVN